LQLLQLADFTRGVYGVPAVSLARVTGATGINALPRLGFGQEVPGHADVAVLHSVHVRAHQCRNVDALRAVLAALAALLAELGLGDEGLVGEEFLLGVGICQVANHREVLLQMLVGAESGDRGGDEIMVQHPFEQSGLALRGEFFGKFGIGADRTSCLGFMATIPILLLAAFSMVASISAS